MSMEKHGAIVPGNTPDTEQKLEKQGQSCPSGRCGCRPKVEQQTRQLDDDVRNRLAQPASEK